MFDSDHMLGCGWLERRILRMFLHITTIVRAPAELQARAPAVRAIGGRRHGRKFILPVRQSESVTEASIRAQSDCPAPDGYRRICLSSSVDDEFGVHIEPKSLPTFESAE